MPRVRVPLDEGRIGVKDSETLGCVDVAVAMPEQGGFVIVVFELPCEVWDDIREDGFIEVGIGPDDVTEIIREEGI